MDVTATLLQTFVRLDACFCILGRCRNSVNRMINMARAYRNICAMTAAFEEAQKRIQNKKLYGKYER